MIISSHTKNQLYYFLRMHCYNITETQNYFISIKFTCQEIMRTFIDFAMYIKILILTVVITYSNKTQNLFNFFIFDSTIW